MPLLPTRLHRIARRLLCAPLFTSVAVLTLALGIGANAAIFSVINGVLLKPLPYAEADRLVGVWHSAPGINIPLMNQGPATYLTYREESQTFEDIGLWAGAAVSVTGAGEPERVEALRVTDGLLGVLRAYPALGRSFTADDDRPGGPDNMMIAYGYWQRKFGGDPGIVGRVVTVDGVAREVIGVLPEGFRFLGRNPQIFYTFRFNRAELFVGNFSYQGIARLKPGVTLEQANADVARVIPMHTERWPLPPGFSLEMLEQARLSPNVRPLSVDVVGDIGGVLWVLLGTVGLVLLIACANVANLFLVRAEGRQQELAIHAALGASRGRITWELLSESLSLAALGGAAGLLLAHAAIRTIVAIAPDALPRVEEIGVDGMVIAFTVGVSLLAGLLFGLLPVLKFARPHLATALKEGGRASSDGRARHLARNTLVVAEIALAVVLLVGSGLMLRTFQAMRTVDPGFTGPADVLTFRIAVPESLVPDPEHAVRTHQQIAERLTAVPGVTSVGVASAMPMDGNRSMDPIFVEDFPGAEERMPPIRRFTFAGERYFETIGTRMVAGRALTWHDALTRAEVIVVSESFAREYWDDPRAALGRRIRETPQNRWRTIVGVVADVRQDGLAQPAPATVYWPLLVEGMWMDELRAVRYVSFAVRTERAGSPTLLQEIQQAVWAVNPNLPVSGVRTLETLQAESMAQTSFAMVILGIASAVALILGIVGIYGVISYVATQRTREIGIRIALGATRGDVTGLFLRQALLLAGVGIVIGMAAALGATRAMASMLFGVSATDPLTYAIVGVAL
ncbi:MAG: ABC transporter permease, partial [Acidobacteria bacterium]|nr:ABC transporter permease [Acidobacteriota bacterium]